MKTILRSIGVLIACLWLTWLSAQKSDAILLELEQSIYAILDTEPVRAIELIDSTLGSGALDRYHQSRLLFYKSDAYYFLDDLRRSHEVLQQCLDIMPENYPDTEKVVILNAHAQNLSSLGYGDEAIETIQSAISIAKAIDDSIELSNLYYNLGLEHKYRSDYTRALQYIDSSTVIIEKLQDSLGLSHTYRLVGSMQDLFYNHAEARSNYHSGLKYVASEDPSQACAILTSISSSWYAEEIYDSASVYADLALRCSKRLEDPLTAAYAYKARAEASMVLGDTASALAAVDSAIYLTNAIGDHKEYLSASCLRMRLRPQSVSDEELEELMSKADSFGLTEAVTEGYEIMEARAIINRDYQKAHLAARKQRELRQQLVAERNQRVAESQSIRLGVAEKEHQLRLSEEKLKTKQARWKSGMITIASLVLGLLGLAAYRVKRRNHFREKEKLEKETELLRQIADVESQAFRAQMNPHFIFNALNSIKGFIVSQKSKDAAIYISRFSKLVRSVLDQSKQKHISLQEELESLELYIKLEQLRFRDGFDYQIILDDSLESHEILIPPIVFQPFVENAIWHGFKENPRSNQLSVSIKNQDDQLYISIRDNGVGRKVSAERKGLSSHKSHGMEITQHRLERFASGIAEPVKIVDLIDSSGVGTGTEVQILLPQKMSYDQD